MRAWNSRGQPTSITDPNGVVTDIQYDGDGRIVTFAVDVGSQSPATAIIAWSVAGDITKITEPNGAWTAFAYDAARRLASVTDSVGNQIAYVRDAFGDATSITVTAANGTTAFTKSQVFDQLGRLIQWLGATPATWTYSFGYDTTDNLVAWHDRQLRLRQFPVDDVEIGAAYAACFDPNQDFAIGRLRDRELS